MKKTILFLLLLTVTGVPGVQSSAKADELSARFPKLKNAVYAVYAVSLPGENVLMDVNSREPLNPASCIKLLTTAAALRTLGAVYQFPTDFFLVKNGDNVDLWVKGYGDPAFVIERLEDVANKLVKAGLPPEIDNIYVDESYFSDGDFPGRQRKSSRSYNALTGAVSLNHSSVTIEVAPGAGVGSPAIVKSDSFAVKVRNHARTSSARSRSAISIKKVSSKAGEEFIVKGKIALGREPQKRHFSLQNPSLNFGASLKELLKERGIRISGAVQKEILPKGAAVFFEEKSPPLAELIVEMNKQSSNFRAEQITKAIGAKAYGAPGTTEKGVAVIGDYLSSIGGADFFVENGSGLSYHNKITAKDLYLVMKDMFKDPATKTIYMDSLSIAGVDGTLKKWKNTPLAGELRGKTGSLNGVSTLAGFMPDGKKTILFVIFLNGNGIDFHTGRKISQKITESLLK